MLESIFPEVISSRVGTLQGLIDLVVFLTVFLAVFHACLHYYQLHCTVRNNQDALSSGQFVLAAKYYSGLEVPQDTARAIALWEQAAAQGHAKAQHYLGELYLRGDGVTQDKVRTIVLWERAASQGHAESQAMLGALYLKSTKPSKTSNEAALRKRGTQHNELQARGMALLEQAAAQGNENALNWLDRANLNPRASGDTIPPSEQG